MTKPQPADAPPRAPFGRRALRWLREIAVAIVAFAVVSTVVGQLRAPPAPAQPYAFVGSTIDGDRIALDDFAGQWVVLNFWATWCGPCLREMPAFQRFAENNPEIAVLGVSTDGSRGKLKAIRKKLELDYPLLMPDPAHSYAYEVSAYPTTVFINPEGEVDRIHVGQLWRPQLWWFTR